MGSGGIGWADLALDGDKFGGGGGLVNTVLNLRVP